MRTFFKLFAMAGLSFVLAISMTACSFLEELQETFNGNADAENSGNLDNSNGENIPSDDNPTETPGIPWEDDGYGAGEGGSSGGAEIHRHIYTAEQVGYPCDPDGYVVYVCECGDQFIVNNFRPHLLVNGVCIYCGYSDLVTYSGYTYATDLTQSDAYGEVISGVTVTLTDNQGQTYSTISGRDGFYSFEDLKAGVYGVSFAANGYMTVQFDILLDQSKLQNIFFDIAQDSTLNGRVTKADYDLNYGNNLPLANALVTIEKTTGTGVYTSSMFTDVNGNYSFGSLPCGIYRLTVEMEGYIVLTQYLTIDVGIYNITNEMLEMIEMTGSSGSGSASGMIYDAAIQGDVGISGLTLTVRAGVNNLTGEILLVIHTGTNGSYMISGLASGNYTVSISDERVLENETMRYGNSYFNIKVLEGGVIANQNGSVSNGVFSGQIRIILEWGSSPSDLDSHLTGPASSTTRFHVFFSSMSYSANGTLYANLDRDDTSSYGPETTTIYENVEGIYRFSVHDYSNKSSSNATGIATSGATVKVYYGDVLRYTFYAPDEAGTLWTVFEYDSSTGILTAINRMSYNSSPSQII